MPAGPLMQSAQRQALLMAMQPQAAETRTATPSKPGIGPWPYLAMAGGNGLDLGSTLSGLNRPGTREANPVFGGSKAAIVAGKAGGSVLIAAIMRALAKKGHPKAAKMLGYLDGGAMGAVGLHNLRQGR